jgi:hypothetical protein
MSSASQIILPDDGQNGVQPGMLMPAGGMDLDPGPQDLVNLPDLLQDEPGIGVLRVSFQKAILPFKNVGGGIESFLGQMGGKNATVRGPSRMKGLGPGTRHNIPEGPGSRASCDPQGIDHLLFIQIEKLLRPPR